MSAAAEDVRHVREVLTFWERARVLVVGASILFSIVTGTWIINDRLGSIDSGLGVVKEQLEAVKQQVSTLSDESRVTRDSLAALTSKAAALDEWKKGRERDADVFWSQHWPAITARLSRLETGLFGIPELRQAPPHQTEGVPR